MHGGEDRGEILTSLIPWARQRHTWALHSLHGCHPWRHTRHWCACQVGCTIGAESPAKLQETLALGARPLELLATRWTYLEIRLYTRMTVVARLTLGHLCEERFFL